MNGSHVKNEKQNRLLMEQLQYNLMKEEIARVCLVAPAGLLNLTAPKGYRLLCSRLGTCAVQTTNVVTHSKFACELIRKTFEKVSSRGRIPDSFPAVFFL